MTYTYAPKGVCSRKITLEVEDGTILSVAFQVVCDGNLKGVSTLVAGMKVEDAIQKLEGIRCVFKSTSCPDQLAQALKESL